MKIEKKLFCSGDAPACAAVESSFGTLVRRKVCSRFWSNVVTQALFLVCDAVYASGAEAGDRWRMRSGSVCDVLSN